jgi:Family of unknown function (DUF6069)
MSTEQTAQTSRKLFRDATFAAIAAAIATTLVAAGAKSLDVTLLVQGKPIPLSAFAFWTVVATAFGTALAAVLSDRRHFLKITVALTALSLAPSVLAPDDTPTKLALIATHLTAAIIVIPVLLRRSE